MKTNEEIEELKRNWQRDPCWDIEDTEGFEEHMGELKAFRLFTEEQWSLQRQKHHDKLDSKVCPLAFFTYRTHLEGSLGTTQLNPTWGKCQVEKCAWWDETEDCCVIRALTKR